MHVSEEVVNAKISSTMLGLEDHGIFTFGIALEGGAWIQTFGGFRSDAPGLATVLMRMMEVVGVEKWEQLPGKLVRIRRERAILAIGHIMEEKWITMEEIPGLLGAQP